MVIKFHLDIDIGGDIDDLCALAMVMNWPDVELLAVTTNIDDGGKRAGYARYVLDLAGQKGTAVAAGADVSLDCYRWNGQPCQFADESMPGIRGNTAPAIFGNAAPPSGGVQMK